MEYTQLEKKVKMLLWKEFTIGRLYHGKVPWSNEKIQNFLNENESKLHTIIDIILEEEKNPLTLDKEELNSYIDATIDPYETLEEEQNTITLNYNFDYQRDQFFDEINSYIEMTKILENDLEYTKTLLTQAIVSKFDSTSESKSNPYFTTFIRDTELGPYDKLMTSNALLIQTKNEEEAKYLNYALEVCFYNESITIFDKDEYEQFLKNRIRNIPNEKLFLIYYLLDDLDQDFFIHLVGGMTSSSEDFDLVEKIKSLKQWDRVKLEHTFMLELSPKYLTVINKKYPKETIIIEPEELEYITINDYVEYCVCQEYMDYFFNFYTKKPKLESNYIDIMNQEIYLKSSKVYDKILVLKLLSTNLDTDIYKRMDEFYELE